MSKFNEYLEGTWAIPETPYGYQEAIDKLEKLQEDLWNIIGDDIFMDHIESAIEKQARKEGK